MNIYVYNNVVNKYVVVCIIIMYSHSYFHFAFYRRFRMQTEILRYIETRSHIMLFYIKMIDNI